MEVAAASSNCKMLEAPYLEWWAYSC